MAWVAGNTARDATFVVVTQRFWAGDRVAEWLPALSERHVLDTVQGTEWLPKDRGFWHTMQAYDQAQECGAEDAGCMLGWAKEYGHFDYIYIPKTSGGYMTDGSMAYCCGSLRFSLTADPAFKLVYDGAGAWIFQYLGG